MDGAAAVPTEKEEGKANGRLCCVWHNGYVPNLPDIFTVHMDDDDDDDDDDTDTLIIIYI